MSNYKDNLNAMKTAVHEVMEYVEYDIGEINEAHDLYSVLDYNGSLHDQIDSFIGVYYHNLRKWSVDNYQYIGDALEEGILEGVTDFHQIIQGGQYMYWSGICRNAVEEIYEEMTA